MGCISSKSEQVHPKLNIPNNEPKDALNTSEIPLNEHLILAPNEESASASKEVVPEYEPSDWDESDDEKSGHGLDQGGDDQAVVKDEQGGQQEQEQQENGGQQEQEVEQEQEQGGQQEQEVEQEQKEQQEQEVEQEQQEQQEQQQDHQTQSEQQDPRPETEKPLQQATGNNHIKSPIDKVKQNPINATQSPTKPSLSFELDDFDDFIDTIKKDTNPNQVTTPNTPSLHQRTNPSKCSGMIGSAEDNDLRCSSLHCLNCDFSVSMFDGKIWHTSTDYLFLRNNYPETVHSKLMEKKGFSAYCCQCRSDSTEELRDPVHSDVWICSGH